MEKVLEVLIDQVFVYVLQGFVLVVVPYFLGVVRLLVMQQQQGDACAVEPATPSDPVAVVGYRWWDVEEDDVAEVWEVESSRCYFSTDHDSVLNIKIITFSFLKAK